MTRARLAVCSALGGVMFLRQIETVDPEGEAISRLTLMVQSNCHFRGNPVTYMNHGWHAWEDGARDQRGPCYSHREAT